MKKVKIWLSIAALKLGLRKRTEADDLRDVNNYIKNIGSENEKSIEEWLHDGSQYGSALDRLLYQFAVIHKEEIGIQKRLKTWRRHFISKAKRQALNKRASEITEEMYQIESEVSTQIIVDEELSLK